MKPQAKATAPTPPQFGHDGIDPVRALLILGLPVLATAVTLLVLFASPLAWWIASGVAVAGVAGGVLVRRSGKARGLLRRLTGAGRVRPPGVRRTRDGRFSRSPLGRVFNRALGRRTRDASGGGTGGSSTRPKTLGGKLRSLLPSWAGGTRKPSSANSPGGSGKPSPGGRMRSLLSRLKPGGGRRPGGAGGSSSGGSKTKRGSLLGKAIGTAERATGRASRAVGTALFGIQRKPSPPGGSGSSKPTGGGKPSGGGSKPDSSSNLDLGVVWTGLGASGKLVGRGVGALYGRWKKRKKTDPDPEDDFDPNSTYENGIEGEAIDGKHADPDLGEIAKRARKLAKKRAKAKPVWPNLDVDNLPPDLAQEWPDEDPDDYVPEPEQRSPKKSLPAEQDPDPPPSPPASPPPHRETRGEKPRPTSTNNTHGGTAVSQSPKITQKASPSGISAANYAHHIRTTPDGRATGWNDAADDARRDAVSFDGKADKKIAAAEEFERTGNQVAASKRREEAAQLREDASTCRTIAAGYQAEAGEEADSAA